MYDYLFCQWQIFWLLAKADILLLLLLPPHSAANNLTSNTTYQFDWKLVVKKVIGALNYLHIRTVEQ